ncbi:MAG: YigZ family protein [Oscillospiraceae bacterium]|nr:YigZ family protein [Oscillospiraceae bacterium]
MKQFRVPYEPAESEFAEKRSRFIGHIWPVETEEEAQAHIKAMKSQYYDARHNCWCYLIGDNIVRYSDDGEPQGTAGQPMLKVFQRENVTNVCCVVTRYFGGILLGAGGLTRAYSRSAKETLSAAGAATMGLWRQVRLHCPYPLLERVKLEIGTWGGLIDDTEYGAEVTVTASMPEDGAERLQDRLTELSAGGIILQVLGENYRPGLREEVDGAR